MVMNTYSSTYPQPTVSAELWIDNVEFGPTGGYSGTANAEASMYGGNSLAASGSFNALALFMVPAIAVILLRIRRTKR